MRQMAARYLGSRLGGRFRKERILLIRECRSLYLHRFGKNVRKFYPLELVA